MKKLKYQKGIGLVEVIAALGISIIVITSLVSLTIFSLRSSQRSKMMLEATKEANKQMELLRALRDSSPTWEGESASFVDLLTGTPDCVAGYCQIQTDLSINGFTPAAPGSLGATQMESYFQIEDPTNNGIDWDVVRVAVTARYRVGDQVKTTNIYTDLTNWQNK